MLLRTQLLGCEGERSGLNHWTDMTQRSWNKSCGHIRKWTSVLWARVQLHRMWSRKTEVRKTSLCEVFLLRSLSLAQFIRLSWITSDEKKVNKPLPIAFRNGTLDSNAGRNVKRSADVWGNARHFCDGELNYTGCEAERQKTKKSSQVSSFCFSWIPNHSHCEERSGLNYCILVIAHSPELPLAFLSHLHYHRTNKKKEFFICTRIVFVVIINVFILGWP